jgi:hypothetical protein
MVAKVEMTRRAPACVVKKHNTPRDPHELHELESYEQINGHRHQNGVLYHYHDLLGRSRSREVCLERLRYIKLRSQ